MKNFTPRSGFSHAQYQLTSGIPKLNLCTQASNTEYWDTTVDMGGIDTGIVLCNRNFVRLINLRITVNTCKQKMVS